jgi:hypothetical protein
MGLPTKIQETLLVSSLSQKKWTNKPGIVVRACNPSYSGGRDQEAQSWRPAWANSLRDPILKNPSQNRTGGVAQVVKCLPSKCEALSSNPNTEKKKKVYLKNGQGLKASTHSWQTSAISHVSSQGAL